MNTPETINAYQKNQTRVQFITAVGNKTYTAGEVWHIIDQLYDLAEIKQIDFKDLY